MITTKLNPNSIPSSAITTDKISNKSVTYEKLSDEVKNMFGCDSVEIEYCGSETTLRENCVFIFDDESYGYLTIKIPWYENEDGEGVTLQKDAYPYTIIIKHNDYTDNFIRLLKDYDIQEEINWSDKNINGIIDGVGAWDGYYKIPDHSNNNKITYTEIKLIYLRSIWIGKVTHYFKPSYYSYNPDCEIDYCGGTDYDGDGCASESICTNDCTSFGCSNESGYCPNESGYCPNESGYCPNESGHDSSCLSDNCGGTDYDGDGCLGEYISEDWCEIDNCGGTDYNGDGCETENGCEDWCDSYDDSLCDVHSCEADGCECFGVVTCDEEGCDIYY